jgi:hypothetical protein
MHQIRLRPGPGGTNRPKPVTVISTLALLGRRENPATI